VVEYVQRRDEREAAPEREAAAVGAHQPNAAAELASGDLLGGDRQHGRRSVESDDVQAGVRQD
jgi:hypothetical protein